MCRTIKRVLANHATREIHQKFYEIMAVCALCVGVNHGPVRRKEKVAYRLYVKMRLLSAFKRCALHDHMRNEITGIKQGLNIFSALYKIRYNKCDGTERFRRLQEDRYRKVAHHFHHM